MSIELPDATYNMQNNEIIQRYSDYQEIVKTQDNKINANRKINSLQADKIEENRKNIQTHQNFIAQNVRNFNNEQAKNQKLFKEWENWGKKENDFTVKRIENNTELINKNNTKIFANTQNMENYNTNHLKNNTKTNENINQIKSNLITLSNSLKTDYLPRQEFTSNNQSIKSLDQKLNESINTQKSIELRQNKTDETLTQWSKWGEKVNNFNTDNYVTKNGFEQIKKKVTDNSKNVGQNALDITKNSDDIQNLEESVDFNSQAHESFKQYYEGQKNSFESKIESKLDSSKFNDTLKKDETIKDIQTKMRMRETNLNNFKKLNRADINAKIREVNSKIESKLDTTEFDNKLGENQTIKQIQENLRNTLLSNSPAIQSLETKVTNNDKKITDIDRQLSTKLSIDDLEFTKTSISNLDTRITNNNSEISSLKNLQNLNTQKFNDVDSKLNEKITIKELQSKLVDYDSLRFKKEKGEERKRKGELDNLNSRITDNSTKISGEEEKNTEKFKGINTYLLNLVEKEKHQGDINNLQNQIAANTGSIGNYRTQIEDLQNKKETHERTIKQIQEDLEKESQANSMVLRTNGNNIANIQTDLASKNSVISKNTQDITKGLETISKLNEVNRIYGEDLKTLDFFSRKTNELARQNETDIKNQKNQNVTFDVFMRGNNQKIKDNTKNISDNTSNIKRNDDAIRFLTRQESNDLEKVENEITANKEGIQFLNQTYNQELTRLETNINKNNDETKLNIKNIQESLNNKIKTNSEDIEDVKSILPALNNSTNKVKAQAKTNSDSIEEMKQQNANVRRNVNTKLLKQTSDIRKNTDSINELKNTTLKQLQQENSKNKQIEIERQNRIKKLSSVKDDVEKQLRGLRSAIAFNSMNMLEMDEELQKQKLINLATMSQLARLKKNPFFNLKM